MAEASRVVAEGGHPMPVPSKGPVELIALSDSFNDMAAKLEKAQAAERQFLLSVSHELKTPLTAIDGYAELLTEGAVDGEQVVPVLRSEAGRLRRLVSDLLDLAKLSQSTFAIREEQVDCDAVAGEVVRRHAARAKELGVQLLALSSGTAARVRGDDDRVVQAVSNLVENALGCVPGGGLVTVETNPGEVIVRDDGPGLAAEDLPRAFERFYLHDRMKSDRDSGTGLGLALVKELVEKMGGRVSVASEPGEGAVFSLKLQPARAGSWEDARHSARGSPMTPTTSTTPTIPTTVLLSGSEAGRPRRSGLMKSGRVRPSHRALCRSRRTVGRHGTGRRPGGRRAGADG